MLLSLLLPFALTIAAGAADADSADNTSGIEGGNTVTNYAPNEKKTLEFSEELVRLICGKEKADDLKKAIMED